MSAGGTVSNAKIVADGGPDFSKSKPFPVAVSAFRHVAGGDALPELTDLQRTDAAVVREYVLAVQDEWRFDRRVNQWRHFEEPVWRLDQIGQALVRLQEHLEQRAVEVLSTGRTKADRESVKFVLKQLDARRLSAVLQLAASHLSIRGDEFDRDRLVFSAQNGVINLRDGTFRHGRPGDYLSLQGGAAYDPEAEGNWVFPKPSFHVHNSLLLI